MSAEPSDPIANTAGDAAGVLIVDDQRPFRLVARTVVGVTGGFTVVGEAESGEDAVEMVRELRPGIVLMDINLGEMNGIEATRRIVADAPDTVVVLMSTYNASDLPAGAADCGAVRYVHKEDFGPSVLRDVWPG